MLLHAFGWWSQFGYHWTRLRDLPKDFSSSQNSGQWFDPQPKKLKSRHLGVAGKVSLEHLKHYWMVQRNAWHLEVWGNLVECEHMDSTSAV